MNEKILSGEILDDHTEITLRELCYSCSQHTEWVIELVEEGILDPVGRKQEQWRFSAGNLHKAQTAMRLQRDLGVNLAGVALALDLLQEIELLWARLNRMGTRDS